MGTLLYLSLDFIMKIKISSEVTLGSYTGGPLGRVNYIKLDGAYMVGYSILCIFHRSKVLF